MLYLLGAIPLKFKPQPSPLNKIVQDYWFQGNRFRNALARPAGLWQNRDMNARWIRFLVMIAIGVGFGLLYGWVLEPVQYVDTAPDSLRMDYKTDYVLMVSEAYQVERDLNLAVQRLSLLGGEPLDTVIAAIAFAQNPELPPTSSMHALLINIGAIEPLRSEPYALVDIQLMRVLADALRTVVSQGSVASHGNSPTP